MVVTDVAFLNIISAYVYKGVGKQSLLSDVFSWSGHRLSQKRLVHFNVDGIDFSISLVLNPIKPRDIAFVIRRQFQALKDYLEISADFSQFISRSFDSITVLR
jgi:hypothetical protein